MNKTRVTSTSFVTSTFPFAPLILLPLIGGMMMGITPSPLEAWPLAWIALVPLWFILSVGRTSRRGDAGTGGRGDGEMGRWG
ncbi:MAG: hypothetical protein F6K41_44435, partial [Symploca sp. SIO3E6]|nr:hypothetical protein [Caldora sp. SIO3E6]